MLAAARIGIPRGEWTRMTPRELTLWRKAYREKLRAEARADRHNTYNLASLIRAMVWAKHAPSFEAAFPSEARKNMSDEQMFAQVQALNKLFGGTEEA